jgi:hypothetical protein
VPAKLGGGLFLKSDCIGFQIIAAFSGKGAPKGRCMKSAIADFIADQVTTLQEKGEVVILTHSENLPSLRKRWKPRQGKDC